MSKIRRSLSRLDRAMNAGMSKREHAHMRGKHRRWPLGTPVMANTPVGLLRGRVFKHWRSDVAPHGCSVEFDRVVDLGDANGGRYCHVIPFRNLRPLVLA